MSLVNHQAEIDELAIKSAFNLSINGALDIIDLINAASKLELLGRHNEAIKLYQLWLQHSNSPLAYIACFNLGVALASERDYAQAESMYRKALEQNPDLFQARLNLANTLEQRNCDQEALDQWQQVLNSGTILQPANQSFRLHALNNMGRLLEIKKRYQEALARLKESFSLDPTQRDVLLHLIHLTQKICQWPVYDPPEGISKEEMIQWTSPLSMLATSDDPKLQYESAENFLKYKYPPVQPLLLPTTGYSHDKIRVGYLSSDFCLHAVSILTVELIELHDRQRFEIYGFCWSREDGSAIRNRVMNAMDHFVRINELNDKEAAECIRTHEIDILIDLHGLTSGARPMILAHRPAPVQMTYLGFPGTTGMPWIDYVIADRYLIPEETAQYFAEKPLYLPDCFQSSDSKREVGPRPMRVDNCLPEGAFVYCSFNNNYKFTPEMFAVWMRILKRVPGSVLWLLADNEWARENLQKTAKKLGVKKDRLIFASRVAPPDYLARYQLADLFLDTFPFNGGTTANDALWMGLPLLTLSGRSFASRMAGSLLTNLQLPELISKNFEEYENKAVQLAKERKTLNKIQHRLKENVSAGLVFNTSKLVRSLEDRFLEILNDSVSALRCNLPKYKDTISLDQRKFLIAAPKYSHHSAGIHSLYNLCDALNNIGREAYIIHYEFVKGADGEPSTKFGFSANPNDYPKNLPHIKMPLFAVGMFEIAEFIRDNYVVYPEVVRGNPLGANRVIRYVLNSESANGYLMEHGKNDFILTYSRAYIENYHHELFQLFYNPLFNDVDTLDYKHRTLDLTYIGKGTKYGPCHIIKNTVELSRDWPREKSQLASLLRSTKYVFSWDSLSQTLVDSVLCGAVPVILRYDPHPPEKIDSMELGRFPRIDCTFDKADNITFSENDNFLEQRHNFLNKYFYYINSFRDRVASATSEIDRFFN
jgi:predicted O-linked N-acetylglucosamine transferase (SPINDLY family)